MARYFSSSCGFTKHRKTVCSLLKSFEKRGFTTTATTTTTTSNTLTLPSNFSQQVVSRWHLNLKSGSRTISAYHLLNRKQESNYMLVNYGQESHFSTNPCCYSRYSPKPNPSYKTFFQKQSSQGKNKSSMGFMRTRDNLQLSSSVEYINEKLKLKENRIELQRRLGNIRKNIVVQNKKICDNLMPQKNRIYNFRRIKTKSKKENIKTIPNLLTTLRLASSPLLSYLVVNDKFGWALGIFILAGFSDLMDGYIARNYKNQQSAFGTALDPMADKILISFLTISLTFADLIPLPLTVLIVSRDVGLVMAAFYFRWLSLGPPKTLSRYFDFSHVTAKILPSNISKVNTGLQLSLVAASLAAPVFDFVGSPWLQMLMYATGGTTVLSGVDYVITWRRRLKFIKN